MLSKAVKRSGESFSAVSIAKPAAIAKGFPLRVPAWYTGPSGAKCDMISFRAAKAPTGSPPPMTFPKVTISAAILRRSCAPPGAKRKPVITSSKISRLSCFEVISFNPSKKPDCGGIQPIFPATGSMIMAAISLGYCEKISSTLARSL